MSQVQHPAETGTVVVVGQAGVVCIAAAVTVMFHSVFTLALPLAAAIVLHMYVLLTAHVEIVLLCLWAARQQDLLKMFKAVAAVVFADIYMAPVPAVALA